MLELELLDKDDPLLKEEYDEKKVKELRVDLQKYHESTARTGVTWSQAYKRTGTSATDSRRKESIASTGDRYIEKSTTGFSDEVIHPNYLL